MRNSIIAAGLFAGFGMALLVIPAAAIPFRPSLAVGTSTDMLAATRMRRSDRPAGLVRHQQYRFNQVTRGAPAGSSGGNGVTGSVAAPSGKN